MSAKGKSALTALRAREMKFGYLFVAPALICLIIFTFIPIVDAVSLSFFDYNAIATKNFIGLANYQAMFADESWIESLGITAKYVLMYVPALFVISLCLALIIRHITSLSGLFRTTFFMPIIVSATAAGIIFKMVFNKNSGFINMAIRSVGLNALNWLGVGSNALICCVILAVWLGMGYYMIIFLAGLQDIPKDYYEAARIDGANALQQFRHITLPCLSQTSIFVFVMLIINAFQTFDSIKMLTDGGPNDATKLAVLRIYENSFIHFRMGYSCATSLMLFAIIFSISLIQLKITGAMSRE